MPRGATASALSILLLSSLACPRAGAASFAVVATVPGSPAIGAVKSTTIYGTTPYGGSGQAGTGFSLTKSGPYTLLHGFAPGTDGNAPNGGLAMNAAGDVFGTAQTGGANGSGTLWQFTAAGSFALVHTFGAGS